MTMGRQIVMSVGAGALVLGAAACAAAPAEEAALAFGEPHQVSSSTEVGTAPMFSVAPNGQEAVAWVSAPDGGTDGRLYVSVDGQPAVELSDPLGPIEPHGEAPPKLAFGPDGALNAIYVVPRIVPGARFPQAALRFVRSTDGGKTWSAPATVTDDSEFGSHNFHALHAAADGTLYVTWLGSAEGTSTVFLTRSSDAGTTWAAGSRITPTESCPCCRTAIASGPEGAVYVGWRIVNPGNVRDVVVARSGDHGQTFSAPVVVHDQGWVYPGCPHAGPAMQVDDQGRLHVAWWTGKEGIAGVYYARSDDGAKTFGTYVPLGVAEFSAPAHVQLALGPDNTVLVAWDDGTVATPKVVVRASYDGGATFADAVALSDEGVAATFPVLGVSGADVTVAWAQVGAQVHHEERTADSIRAALDPNAPHGLMDVGQSVVVARRGTLPLPEQH
jgi:hypothetical protein